MQTVHIPKAAAHATTHVDRFWELEATCEPCEHNMAGCTGEGCGIWRCPWAYQAAILEATDRAANQREETNRLLTNIIHQQKDILECMKTSANNSTAMASDLDVLQSVAVAVHHAWDK